MTGLELVLVIPGVVAWGSILGTLGPARSLFRLTVESLAVHTVVSTLLSVALVSGGLFRVTTAQALAAAVPIVMLLQPRRARWPGLRGAPLITRLEKVVVLVLVLVAPVALPRMEPLAMVSDAGVYTSRAIHHLYRGSLIGTIPVRDQLEGDLLETFDRDNGRRMVAKFDQSGERELYLSGTYIVAPNASEFRFQFYPGWPMLIAQWAGIFGLPRMFYAVVFAFSLAVLLFGFLLEDRGLGLVAYVTAAALFASSPLLLYFSKYTTSEALLLFLFLFVLYFFGLGDALGATLAAAGFAAIVVTHVSTFLYAPLVLLLALEGYRSTDRRLASFAAAAFAILLGGIALGLLISPDYLLDIFFVSFRIFRVEDRIRLGLALVLFAYAAGLALAVGALWRARKGAAADGGGNEWPGSHRKLVRAGIWVLLGAILACTLYRGYLLGWTDHYLPQSTGPGAWSARSGYAGGGWSALAHLNIVSMVMASSLVGLPLVLVLSAWRGDRVCAVPRRCLLLCAVLLSLAIYTFVRVDTPVNYYASRYFIPVLVPSVMLLFAELLEVFRFRPAVVIILALVGLGFNLRSDVVLYRESSRDDEMRFVEEVAARVGEARILFVRNPERNHKLAMELLAVPLAAAHDISLVNVVGSDETPVDRLISTYARHLELRDAAVISRRPPDDGRDFEAIYLMQRRLRPSTFYPQESSERRDRYYLYNLAFRGLATEPSGSATDQP